jgi:hypothetical protein
MARPITIRQPGAVPAFKGDEPQLTVIPKPFWSPPKGLDYLNRKSRIDPAHSPEMMNFLLDRGKLVTRHGTSQLGTAATAPVMAVVNFVTGSGIGFLIRFLTTKLQLWDGAAWSDIGGAFTGGVNDYWTYTAFNDTLLFSNNIDGLWEYAPLAGSFQQITLGPNARHLSTYGGRVVASAARGQEYTTEWSDKNNSHAWGDAYIGAGSEDLRSTPGGQVDQVIGTWPITDDIALMVRSNSIWQVTQTGDPEAPFRFERLYAKLGSRSRHSVDVVPGGLIFLSNDDVYMVDTSKPQLIGQLVKDRIFATTDLTKAKGFYRPKLRQYWLTLGSDEVFVYSLDDQGWTRLKYPFNVRWMDESIPYYSGQTWDASVGTWDAQTTAWDQALGTAQSPSFYMATDEALGNVIREDTTSEVDLYTQAGKLLQGIEIQTPTLLPATPLDMVEIIETQMEYEAASNQTIICDYTSDGGITWTEYSRKVLKVTTKTEILKMVKSLERNTLRLRIRSDGLGTLVLVSLVPMLIQGPRRES